MEPRRDMDGEKESGNVYISLVFSYRNSLLFEPWEDPLNSVAPFFILNN